MDRNAEKATKHHYCIVRSDIPSGAQAAQLIHAAGISSPGDIEPGTYAYALHAKNALELNEIAFQLEKAGIKYHMIVESDPPYMGELMALGIEPGDKQSLKKILRRYPLLK